MNVEKMRPKGGFSVSSSVSRAGVQHMTQIYIAPSNVDTINPMRKIFISPNTIRVPSISPDRTRFLVVVVVVVGGGL
jgi:hypothetical protein